MIKKMNQLTSLHLQDVALGQRRIGIKHRLARLLVPLLLCSSASFAHGQLVYKCQSQGKTTYSQEPCLGAQVFDIKPARGPDQPVVRSGSGNDSLRREKEKKMDKNQARSDALLSECRSLDAQEKQQDNVIHNSRDINAVNAAADAFIANRKKHRELGC